MDGRARAEELDAGRRTPRVHSRAQWDARPPRQRAQILDRAPEQIIVHHTATPNTKDYSMAQAYRLSRIVQRFHMESRGWDDIGEQLTISRGGYVMEGRNRSLAAIRAGRHVIGAQALGHNDRTLGIESEGTYSDAPVPVQLWSSLVDTCAWLCEVYDLNPYRAIKGHRDLGDTECPGDVLYERLPVLRRAVARRLSRGVGRRMAEISGPDLRAPGPDPMSSLFPHDLPGPSVWSDGADGWAGHRP
jgi:hypothetical protein